ncbi:hypothetical protein ACFL5I_00720 [Planctomycetota bacterium]
MNQERIKILKMLSEGKITTEEASQLLETMDEVTKSTAVQTERKGKLLKIRVYEGNLDEPKVNINIPLPWIKGLGGFILPKIEAKLKAKGHPVDMKELMNNIASGRTQKIIDVKDGADKVEIWVE